eukprot:TRINITY_DN11121_c0_g1_i1.p1 TRINITY_DN11121_c0_g1~~TRINITY_DN11121_c0_g1_i1.p1  ORF type:complete len:460 (+),score=83.72 TRINITY_DN11121_c0_g1_i1:194-1381(+)
MRDLVGPRYVHPGVPIHVTPSFLQEVQEMTLPLRPANRIDASVDTSAPYAFLIPDLSLFTPTTATTPPHTICMELKPKWGFKPIRDHPHISTDTAVKSTTCRYCMHQYLKASDGAVKHISEYCPLDLYSGDPDRVQRALQAMFMHPQNNLKIYIDGELSFTGGLGGRQASNHASLDELDSKLAAILQVAPHSSPETLPPTVSGVIHAIHSILGQEPVLHNLQTAQMMDVYDVGGIIHLFNRAVQERMFDGDDVTDLRFVALKGSPSVVPVASGHGEASLQDKDKPPIAPPAHIHPSLQNMPRGEVLRTLQCFLSAATAKDCSVMIALRPLAASEVPGPSMTVVRSPVGLLEYRVGVVDLDSRPASLIPHYFKIDQDIVSAYKKYLGDQGPKQCKE